MKILLISMLIVVVSGCVNTAASVTTGKGFIDNVVSEMNGADCRIHRLFKGEEICKEDE